MFGLAENVARAWYLRTSDALNDLSGLGAARSWSARPVSARSSTAKARVRSFLKAEARKVRQGKIKASDFRRLRASVLSLLNLAGARGAGGGSSRGSGGSAPSSAGAIGGSEGGGTSYGSAGSSTSASASAPAPSEA